MVDLISCTSTCGRLISLLCSSHHHLLLSCFVHHDPLKVALSSLDQILITVNDLMRPEYTCMLLILWTCISEHKVRNPTYSADTVARAAGGGAQNKRT